MRSGTPGTLRLLPASEGHRSFSGHLRAEKSLPDLKACIQIAAQLALPLPLVDRRLVVFFAMEGASAGQLLHALDAFGISQVLDVRLSPAFWGPGFGDHFVDHQLVARGIRYHHLPDGATAALECRGEAAVRSYRLYLEGSSEVRTLVEALRDRGPSMILGWGGGAEPIERAAFLTHLSAAWPGTRFCDSDGGAVSLGFASVVGGRAHDR